MVLEKIGQPLVLKEISIPEPGPFEVRIKVKACGVCRTDLHIVDGELSHPKLPLILGHQVVGVVDKLGERVLGYKVGSRVGVPWLGSACHVCEFCLSKRENLCDKALYTGYSCNGGYAEYMVAHEDYILPLSFKYSDLEMAPLLCAGLIGYRAFKLAGQNKSIGFYGLGSSAHILTQIVSAFGLDVYVFTRPGDLEKQAFALSLGAKWAGGSDAMPSKLLDAALIFASDGALYPKALRVIKKGGRVVSAGIHMSDIPSFAYDLLWGERSISSVANLTRQDGFEFMKLIEEISVKVSVTVFPLDKANQALSVIRAGSLDGSAVLVI